MNTIQISYCSGCRWMLRASWLAQEILSTFENEDLQVLLSPSTKGGTFQILLLEQNLLLWDRIDDEGFPEAKELKQRIRDVLFPQKNLGHSDKT